ncbi:Uncharacterized protein SCF082_LOCUS12053, partial [Durusdinium trenchii]
VDERAQLAERELLADLELKRDEVVAMRRQHESLERELERQRLEIERLKLDRNAASPMSSTGLRKVKRPSSSSSRSVVSSKLSPPDPAFRSQPRVLNSLEFTSREEFVEDFPQSPGDPHHYLEHSMPSESKLVRVASDPSAERLDETWRPGSHSNFRQQHGSAAGATLGHVREEDELEDGDHLSDLSHDPDSPSLVERSLPCASRYFVYVSQRGEENDSLDLAAEEHEAQDGDGQGSAQLEKYDEDAEQSPAQEVEDEAEAELELSPLPRDKRAQQAAHARRQAILTPHRGPGAEAFGKSRDSDFEQSRVRTAQAARMALQRASANSEDEESSRGDVHSAKKKKMQNLLQSASPAAASQSGKSKRFAVHSASAASAVEKDSSSSPESPGLANQKGGSKAVAGVASKKRWKKDFEPFKVFRSVVGREGALEALEGASKRSSARRSKAAASRRASDSSEDEDEDSVAYGSDDEWVDKGEQAQVERAGAGAGAGRRSPNILMADL